MFGMLFKVLLLTSYLVTVFGISNFPLLLVISFDGFTHTYFDLVPTPNFRKFAQSGVFVPEMQNVFVTQTFPNHYSMATGRYVEDHGVLAYRLFDPILDKVLSFSSPEYFNYDSTVMPLWTLNEMQEDHHSGAMMWIGGEHTINGVKITYRQKFDPSINFTDRLDTVLGWFQDPEKPANVVFLYYDEPDRTGHYFGPKSDEIKAEVSRIDEFVGYLMASVQNSSLSGRLNIVLTTDHGMAEIHPEKMINQTELIDETKVEFYGSSPLLEIRVKSEDNVQHIYEELKSKEEGRHYITYMKDDIPIKYHFSHNIRVPHIIVLAEDGYVFTHDGFGKGAHGYDNGLSKMHGFFMASGPAFLQNHTVTGNFSNLDIYPTACHLLELEPYPHNGTLRLDILRHTK